MRSLWQQTTGYGTQEQRLLSHVIAMPVGKVKNDSKFFCLFFVFGWLVVVFVVVFTVSNIVSIVFVKYNRLFLAKTKAYTLKNRFFFFLFR